MLVGLCAVAAHLSAHEKNMKASCFRSSYYSYHLLCINLSPGKGHFLATNQAVPVLCGFGVLFCPRAMDHGWLTGAYILVAMLKMRTRIKCHHNILPCSSKTRSKRKGIDNA